MELKIRLLVHTINPGFGLAVLEPSKPMGVTQAPELVEMRTTKLNTTACFTCSALFKDVRLVFLY